MRSFLNNQSIDCTAGRLSISSAAPVLCGGNVGCIPRKLFMKWIGSRSNQNCRNSPVKSFFSFSDADVTRKSPIALNGWAQSSHFTSPFSFRVRKKPKNHFFSGTTFYHFSCTIPFDYFSLFIFNFSFFLLLTQRDDIENMCTARYFLALFGGFFGFF